MIDRLVFNAWDEKTGTYWTGEDIEMSGEIIYFITYGRIGFALEDPDWRELKPVQCIGQKDKKENIIFEGFIVKEASGLITKVVWSGSRYYLSKSNGSYRFYPTNSGWQSVEIIGDIYRNPELLQ